MVEQIRTSVSASDLKDVTAMNTAVKRVCKGLTGKENRFVRWRRTCVCVRGAVG